MAGEIQKIKIAKVLVFTCNRFIFDLIEINLC